jgi:hypothetical protein
LSPIGESFGWWFFSGDWGRENFFGRLKKGRSAVSQAAQRVGNDPELMRVATTIKEQLQRKTMQR